MCRFAYYTGPPITLASLVTEPAHSIINQSHHAREREEPLNGDGFGVAWHDPDLKGQFVIFKEVYPAWSSRNLRSLAPAIDSECFLAHVRAATAGSVTHLNCHPFGGGPFAFMHNGGIGGWRRVRRRLLASLSDGAFDGVEGSTDSELIFAMLRDRLPPEPKLDQMATAMLETIEAIEREVADLSEPAASTLNLVLSDGQRAVISRYATPDRIEAESLYYWHGTEYACVDGVCDMSGGGNDAILVTSEPLSADPSWRPVPINHIGLIERGNKPVFRPITFASVEEVPD